ncbi:MAG: LysM peptidoglycan-binding domain-containing protein [Anaerolineales bacterium]|nr:LysM peptidoglycan-binding domain-containing protein [Anaerolineales bacterium]
MHKRSVLLAGALGGLLALAVFWALAAHPGVAHAAPQPATAANITVTVKTGDNLGKYARLYGVSGASLVAANNLPNPNLIFPGQVIIIPVERTSTPSLTTPFYYTVLAGDTLTAIGKKFEMDGSVIANANGITNGNVVLGSTLLIPAGPHTHIAQKGETLKSIAAAHGTTWDKLAAFNPGITNPDVIFSGQPVYIPVRYNAAPLALHGAGPLPSATPSGPTNTTVPGATATATKPAPAVNPPTGGENWIKVSVRSGESFVTYVARYGVTGGRLRLANPHIADPNIIHPGDTVFVPVNVSFTPSRTTPFFYIVKAGDTTASIAAKFELATTTLTNANPGATFAAGSTLLLPAGPHLYTVRQGDTLGKIATKYGTTTEFLLTGNQLPDPNAIYLGQLIYIPTQYDKQPLPYD